MSRNKKSENSELEILQKVGKTVVVNEETIEVRPFKFGQLLKALKYLANIASDFTATDVSEFEIISALTHHTEDMLSLLCLATGKDRAFFDEISSEDGIDLALAAWEVNKDFFVQRLAPKIQQLTDQAQAQVKVGSE